MRWQVLIILPLLAGCADGAILGADKPNKPGASYISVSLSDEEHVFLKPMNANGKDYERLKDPGLWVSGGWFMVEYHCDAPKEHPQMMVIDEYGEEDTVHIKPGRWYTLACDDKAAFVLNIVDHGDAAAQR